MPYPRICEPEEPITNTEMLLPPLSAEQSCQVQLVKGANISSLPFLEPIPPMVEAPVLLKVGDNISTDGILPAGARVLPFRSNIPEICRFAFEAIDSTYSMRAKQVGESGGHVIVGGLNYGQGSSREHAALAPRYLGLRVVVAKGFARIHWQNLVNFGVLPLCFEDHSDYDRIVAGDVLKIAASEEQLRRGPTITIENTSRGFSFATNHQLSERQIAILLEGGTINWVKTRGGEKASDP
jgi:aconitate hydratase